MSAVMQILMRAIHLTLSCSFTIQLSRCLHLPQAVGALLQAETQPATVHEPRSQLHIIAKGQDGSQLQFRLTTTTALQRLFHVYAMKRAKPSHAFVFMSNGARIDGHLTAQQLGLQDWDVIYAVERQTGD